MPAFKHVRITVLGKSSAGLVFKRHGLFPFVYWVVDAARPRRGFRALAALAEVMIGANPCKIERCATPSSSSCATMSFADSPNQTRPLAGLMSAVCPIRSETSCFRCYAAQTSCARFVSVSVQSLMSLPPDRKRRNLHTSSRNTPCPAFYMCSKWHDKMPVCLPGLLGRRARWLSRCPR